MLVSIHRFPSYTSRMFERDLIVKGLRVCKNPSCGCDFFIAHLRFPWSLTGPVLRHLYQAWSRWLAQSHRTRLNCADWFGLYGCNNRTADFLVCLRSSCRTGSSLTRGWGRPATAELVSGMSLILLSGTVNVLTVGFIPLVAVGFPCVLAALKCGGS